MNSCVENMEILCTCGTDNDKFVRCYLDLPYSDEVNNLYYTLDSKVKIRNGIGHSVIRLQRRIEQAQQKMYNISKFLYSAAENYRNAEKQIISNSKRFEDSHRLYDEQYSDYNYIKNLN